MNRLYYLLTFLIFPTLVFADTTPLPPPTSKFTGTNAASLDKINERVTSGFENFFTAMKWIGLIMGILIVMKSLKNIADIGNGKKDGSVGLNVVGIFAGGALTAAATILFVFGAAAERVATGKDF